MTSQNFLIILIPTSSLYNNIAREEIWTSGCSFHQQSRCHHFMLKQARRSGYTFTLTTFLICTIPNNDFGSASASPLLLPLPAPCLHSDHARYCCGPCFGILATYTCIFEKRFPVFVLQRSLHRIWMIPHLHGTGGHCPRNSGLIRVARTETTLLVW